MRGIRSAAIFVAIVGGLSVLGESCRTGDKPPLPSSTPSATATVSPTPTALELQLHPALLAPSNVPADWTWTSVHLPLPTVQDQCPHPWPFDAVFTGYEDVGRRIRVLQFVAVYRDPSCQMGVIRGGLSLVNPDRSNPLSTTPFPSLSYGDDALGFDGSDGKTSWAYVFMRRGHLLACVEFEGPPGTDLSPIAEWARETDARLPDIARGVVLPPS